LLNKVEGSANYKNKRQRCPPLHATTIKSAEISKSGGAGAKEGTMSFLDPGKEIGGWIAAPARRSTRREPGCVQCGARLETDEAGKASGAGKCMNCSDWVSEEDEGFDDLED
jgi:hypothetical protein